MNAKQLADKLEECCLVSWGECTREDYDTDVWTKMQSASMLREQQQEITRLKLEWQYMASLVEELQEFARWMTGCGYDFTQHEYFIKCRDRLLKELEQ